MVKVDKSQIEQVFWNLFVNAIDAMPNGGNLHISTENTTSKMHKNKYFNNNKRAVMQPLNSLIRALASHRTI